MVMKKKILLASLLALGLMRPLQAKDGEPRREAGLFVHLVPRQLAGLQKAQPLASGFVISLPGGGQPAANRPAAGSADELVAFLRRQSAEVQRNGIWLVLAYSKAYTPVEKAHVVELKQACQRGRIPLFIARDQELPKGWQRFSRRLDGKESAAAKFG